METATEVKATDFIAGYALESGISIPPSKWTKSTSRWANMTERMRIGDSVFFKNDKDHSSFTAHCRSHGVKISERKLDGGVRVWRIA